MGLFMFGFKKHQSKMEAEDSSSNQRKLEDRRSFKPAHQFPLLDTKRSVISQDRRKQPDRRLANIEVKHHPFGKLKD